MTKQEVIYELNFLNKSLGFSAYPVKTKEALSIAVSIVDKYPEEQYKVDQETSKKIIDFVNGMCPDASLPEKIIIELVIANAINNTNSNKGSEKHDPSQC